MTLFAEYPHITIVPGFDDPIEIEKVAPAYCHECNMSGITPQYAASPLNPITEDYGVWYMPCHEFMCPDCEAMVSVYNDIAMTQTTTHGEMVCSECYIEPRPRPHYADDCSCDDCYELRRSMRRRSYNTTPVWDRDGLKLSARYRDRIGRVSALVMEEAKTINPVAAMADFYIADYLLARIGMAHRHGLSASNIGHRAAYELRADAKRVRDSVVAMCDGIFRDYLLMAIGGEARHHVNVAMPGGRESSWDWFVGMAAEHGRAYMLRGALELFEDDCWSSSYGGRKWAEITRIALARETGDIDAFTFVDRVFTLEHNGGSCIDKVAWNGYPGRMKTVGNAHASDIPDFLTLFRYATRETLRDLLFDADGYNRVPSYVMGTASDTEKEVWNLRVSKAREVFAVSHEGDLPACNGTRHRSDPEYIRHIDYCPAHKTSIGMYISDQWGF